MTLRLSFRGKQTVPHFSPHDKMPTVEETLPKKYSINWENDESTSFEVDGVSYESLDEVPDEEDRSKLEAMMNGSVEQQFEQEFKDFDKEFQKDWEANKKSAAN